MQWAKCVLLFSVLAVKSAQFQILRSYTLLLKLSYVLMSLLEAYHILIYYIPYSLEIMPPLFSG